MPLNKSKIKKIVDIIFEKKGSDVLLLDIRKHSPATDYFIICTAQSQPHTQAIADELLLKFKKQHLIPHHIEGYNNAQWILLDYFDFVIHIFLNETRQFYGLERLWGDVPQRRYIDQPADKSDN